MAEAAVSKAVTWGLFAAWAANDLEELATMAGWARAARPVFEERFPRVPEAVRRRMELSQRDVGVAIGLMGVVMAAASADGARTGGRSPFFRTVLVGFGVHGVAHLAQSLAYRGYTPGVVTAPTIVVPYSIWAVRRLRAAGIRSGGIGPAAATSALLPVAVAAAHALAHRINRPHGRRARAAV
ncbi:HXXEE domain-containing protein [Streptomyces sp. NBC_00893]|uniref:HXXEE domain-containing protein n=1 Tax=Streptomyces sp. NBC_00893 TaxID=2975862 RepID=UPI002254CE71|nr:HXXEE domain-containing protein [Streptomyces sp. NBC_00893]MCX4848663.1 HXXEE domain-containing protein [Streptomyces sp. NBC_00893]